jgi:hypothetical protein
LELRHNSNPSRQVAQPWRRGAPLTPEQDHDQLGCNRVVAYFLGRKSFGLQERRQGTPVIGSVSMTTRDVDQVVGASLN